MKTTSAVVAAKSQTESDVFRGWLLTVASKVAHAAKEGGFLGFGGERVSAERALEIGLVQRVVPADELMPAALAWARELAALPTTAIGLTKRAFNAALLFDHAGDLADVVFGQVLDSHVGADARARENDVRTMPADAEDVREPDLDALGAREIDT